MGWGKRGYNDHKQYLMTSQLNLFQKYTEEQSFRGSLELSSALSAILDYCEYSIRGDFNANDKQRLKNKNRKKELSEEFIKAFTTLSREEKCEYYIRAISHIRKFVREDFEPPLSPHTGVMNDIGFSRSFNIKRWKEKKLRLDQDRHIMFAQRETKIKTYDMKDYLLRLSKNKEYFSFVLEAINTNPPEKSRTVHIGFSDKAVFQRWYNSIKFAVEFREWELYCYLYRGKNHPKPLERFTSDDIKGISKSFHTQMHDPNRKEDSYDMEEDFLSTSMVLQPNKRVQVDFSVSKSSIQPLKPSKETPPKAKITKELQQMQKLQEQIKEYQVKKQEAHVKRTMVDDLIDGEIFEQPDVFQEKIEEEDEQSKEVKKHLDLFHKIYPQYELDELQLYLNYSILHEEENLKIYQNQILQKRLKMCLTFSKDKYTVEQIISMISKVQTLKELNENIQEMQLKTNIPSENSALIYLVLKPFNRLYRSRDFIFIRHVFKSGKNIYMVDKSIENTNYPPFMTIVRGQLCIVYGIFEREDKFQLIVDVEITNEGYLNLVQETNLTLKYLKAFNKLPAATVEVNSYRLFNLQWDISKNEANQYQNEIRSRRRTINEINKKISEREEENPVQKSPQARNFSKKAPVAQVQVAKSQKIQHHNGSAKSPEHDHHKSTSLSPQTHSNHPSNHSPQQQRQNPHPHPSQKVQIKRFDKKTMEQVGEISVEQIKKQKDYKTDLSIVRKLDKDGYVIIGKQFMKHHYILEPLPKEKTPLRFMDTSQGNPIWKNEWIHDDKQGSMIFIHKKKIEDQKGVLKFILSKMAKNLVSGQSILSISLPVDIFGPESNLQRFIYSMVYGPLLLQGLQKQSAINKLIRTVCFGLTNSVMYLSMQKPFNPILGETFQCWINGCPAYSEQISHHPPIAALMLKGRGYDISAQLESKVSLGVNSGTGTNDGIYRVKFADKTEVCFITPGGEVSGLSHGDRKFNLVGKSYYWISDTNIMLELAFDPFKKGFFSVGKQEQPSDYFQGTIYEVRPEFMAKFIGGKRKQPQEKDRLKSYGKISGIWNKYFKYNNEEIFNYEKLFPLILEFQPNPIPSDANWREDIEYRKRNQVTRAQTEKERLEVLQRKDRKLREKYHKKK